MNYADEFTSKDCLKRRGFICINTLAGLEAAEPYKL